MLNSQYSLALESRKLDLIHLSEEMEIVNTYLFLQAAQFEGGFTFESKMTTSTLKLPLNRTDVIAAYLKGESMPEVSTWADEHQNNTTAPAISEPPACA